MSPIMDTDYESVLRLLEHSKTYYESHGATIEVPLGIAPRCQPGRIVFAFDVRTAKLVDLWVLEEDLD